MKVAAIIAAAGSGSRMGLDKNKLLIEIKGKTVIERTVEKFEKNPCIDAIVVVSADEEIKKIASGFKKVIKIVSGGGTRQKSVFAGLMAAEGYDVVAVHDGARCFVTERVIADAVAVADEKGACVPVCDVIDTIKKVNGGMVCGSVDRNEVKAIQTPQCFKRDLLMRAYGECDGSETDESSIVSKIAPVYTCEGDSKNIKITTKYDLIIGEAIAEGEVL